jgi:hypothetical protein
LNFIAKVKFLFSKEINPLSRKIQHKTKTKQQTEALETKKDPKTSTIKSSKLYNNGPQKIKSFWFTIQ